MCNLKVKHCSAGASVLLAGLVGPHGSFAVLFLKLTSDPEISFDFL